MGYWLARLPRQTNVCLNVLLSVRYRVARARMIPKKIGGYSPTLASLTARLRKIEESRVTKRVKTRGTIEVSKFSSEKI